jgi:endoglucanase
MQYSFLEFRIMRIPLTFILILNCLAGCSQGKSHDFEKKEKIPIDPRRWYQLNNTSHGLEDIFNGRLHDKPNTGSGTVLNNYDAYYPLLDKEQMTINSIRLFDWEGTNEGHPTTIYAILNNWNKIPIAVFTGSKYNVWVGPDPKYPDKYTLDKPVTDIRYLVINSWGDFPGEIEFYGSYTPPQPLSKVQVKYVPLSNFFGVNAFEWDFEAPDKPMQPDPERTGAIKNFTGIRHYMDWEKLESKEGKYAFSPTNNGSWNYDTIYQWCKLQNIEVLPCLKTIPAWLQESYPVNERDNENIPMRYGKDPADPQSYLEQARVAYQFAARYGNNKNQDRSLLTLQPDNKVRTGLGLIRFIECDNERDKWWKGRKAYQTGREYAANLSAFYDGNKNKMGPGAGIKNADPSMKVVMAGLASPTTDYVKGMIDWSKEHRGYKADGSVDLPWDIINYHFYSNDASTDPAKKQTTGAAPELSKADSFANEFIQLSHRYAHDMPVWVTEAGYDINPNSPQKVMDIAGRDALQTQADWILRTSLLYARSGIRKVFFYELYDDNPDNGTRYATSGLVSRNRISRPAADFLYQTNRLFGDYTYKETINKNPVVDHYTLNKNDMYMLVVPSQENRTATYTLDLGKQDSAYIYTPRSGSKTMDMAAKKTNNGKINITVSETPVFVTANKMIKNN